MATELGRTSIIVMKNCLLSGNRNRYIVGDEEERGLFILWRPMSSPSFLSTATFPLGGCLSNLARRIAEA